MWGLGAETDTWPGGAGNVAWCLSWVGWVPPVGPSLGSPLPVPTPLFSRPTGIAGGCWRCWSPRGLWTSWPQGTPPPYPGRAPGARAHSPLSLGVGGSRRPARAPRGPAALHTRLLPTDQQAGHPPSVPACRLHPSLSYWVFPDQLPCPAGRPWQAWIQLPWPPRSSCKSWGRAGAPRAGWALSGGP